MISATLCSKIFICATLATLVVICLSNVKLDSFKYNPARHIKPSPEYDKWHKIIANVNNNKANGSQHSHVILLWTKMYGQADWRLGELGGEPFRKLKCPISNCFVTRDRRLLPKASAVLVHFRDDFDFADRGPAERPPNQYWTFFLWESPEHSLSWNWRANRESRDKLQQLAGFFNWTMTYRQDSDIRFRYGGFMKRSKPLLKLRKLDYLAKKTKNVVWIQSNCDTPSHRIDYVEELAKHIDVDVIGCCQTNHAHAVNDVAVEVCQRPAQFGQLVSPQCNDYIERTYKFQLAFENSLCRDYVTEKFYRAASLNVVPVVYNGADMTRFAPNHSYIDVGRFKNPKALAKYLLKVGSNRRLYNAYLRWKVHFRAENYWDNDGFLQSFCDLCAKVAQVQLNPAEHRRVYADIDHWWTTQGNCSDGKMSF